VLSVGKGFTGNGDAHLEGGIGLNFAATSLNSEVRRGPLGWGRVLCDGSVLASCLLRGGSGGGESKKVGKNKKRGSKTRGWKMG